MLAAIEDEFVVSYKDCFLDYSQDGTHLCIVMEFAAGGDL